MNFNPPKIVDDGPTSSKQYIYKGMGFSKERFSRLSMGHGK